MFIFYCIYSYVSEKGGVAGCASGAVDRSAV